MSAYVSKYSWRSGYSYKTSADVVGKALTEIEQRDGAVTSRAFLEYSRPEESETHDMFEWDDSIAAEKYRLAQSGRIINQLQVEVVYVGDRIPREIDIEVTRTEAPRKVSAFVNVTPRSTRGSAVFNNIQDAMSDENKSKQVLMNALADLKAFEEKYGELKEALAGDDLDRMKELTLEVHAMVHPAEVSGASEKTVADYVLDYMLAGEP